MPRVDGVGRELFAASRRLWIRSRSFFAALGSDAVVTDVVRTLIAWADDQRLRVVGTTTVSAGLAWHLDALAADYTLSTADARLGQVTLYFGSLKNKPVLDDAARRAALVSDLSPHFRIPPDRADITGMPLPNKTTAA